MALIREGSEVGPAETFDVGTLAKIVDFHQLSDGFLGLSCIGEQRFRILSRRVQADGLNLAEVENFPRGAKDPAAGTARASGGIAENRAAATGRSVCRHRHAARTDAAWVGYRLAEILPIAAAEKQFCLELEDPIQRLDVLSPLALRGSS